MPAFGLVMDACALPEFSGVSLETWPAKIVLADADRGAQPVGPARRRIRPQPDVAFLHAVLAHGRERCALQGLEQPDRDVVVAGLQPDAGLGFDAGKSHIESVAGVETGKRAAIELAELVAVDGIVEEIGEIVEELQRRADHIGADLALAVLARLRPVARQAETARGSAVGGIERAEPVDEALIDGALRHLIGRRPAVRIGHRGKRKAVGGGALAVAQHAVQLADIVGHIPRAVVFAGLRSPRAACPSPTAVDPAASAR